VSTDFLESSRLLCPYRKENDMSYAAMFIIPIALIVGFTVIMATVKILPQYERAVVFTRGRFQGAKGPGLVVLTPFFSSRKWHEWTFATYDSRRPVMLSPLASPRVPVQTFGPIGRM
jgi:hypothetical protein